MHTPNLRDDILAALPSTIDDLVATVNKAREKRDEPPIARGHVIGVLTEMLHAELVEQDDARRRWQRKQIRRSSVNNFQRGA